MKQRGPLMGLEPTTDTLRVRRVPHCCTLFIFLNIVLDVFNAPLIWHRNSYVSNKRNTFHFFSAYPLYRRCLESVYQQFKPDSIGRSQLARNVETDLKAMDAKLWATPQMEKTYSSQWYLETYRDITDL